MKSACVRERTLHAFKFFVVLFISWSLSVCGRILGVDDSSLMARQCLCIYDIDRLVQHHQTVFTFHCEHQRSTRTELKFGDVKLADSAFTMLYGLIRHVNILVML